MSDLVRTDYYLGNSKTIVGSPSADLVLETLGKVYVKYGKSTKLLNDLFLLLDNADTSDFSKILIVNGLKELYDLKYPGEGYFIFDTLEDILYITIGNKYIPIVEAANFSRNNYVKKTGDTMTGLLEIFTNNAPLIINSKKLVNNLNVNFLQGHSASDFALKAVNETINGSWTFISKCTSKNNWIFEGPVIMYEDLALRKSIGSPDFASGFAGYGWRLDAKTNTLTVDYLVVRKAMLVYEMVINKISATNGALWVTNASKCDSAKQPATITPSVIKIQKLILGEWYLAYKEVSYKSEDNATTYDTYKIVDYLIKVDNKVLMLEFINERTTEELTVEEFVSRYADEKITVTQINEGTTETEEIPALLGICTIIKVDYNSNKNTVFESINIENAVFSYMDTIDQEDVPIIRNTYYYYFGLKKIIKEVNGTNVDMTPDTYWIVNTDKDEYPVFKPGDIIRCLKVSLENNSIKYYDAVVVMPLASRQYLMQKAISVFDKYSEIHYDESGNITENIEQYNDLLYSRGYTDMFSDGSIVYDPETEGTLSTAARLDDIVAGDNLIQVGSITDPQRQNAVYITSSDDLAPYIDVLSGMNRPDYSVLYRIPVYIKYSALGNDGRTHTYYVSEYGTYNDITGIELGKFKINENLKTITENEEGTTLYGYELPNSLCLIEHYLKEHILKTNPDNTYVTDQEGNPVYEDVYSELWQYTSSTKVRMGKLDGIYNHKFGGKQPHGYGLYGENVYLTGEFHLNNGKSIVSFVEDGLTLLLGNLVGIIDDKIKSIDRENLELAGIKTEPILECTDPSDESTCTDTGLYRLTLLGDEIKFITKPEDISSDIGTALLKNGMLNASLINVKLLSFDKLAGTGNATLITSLELVFTYGGNQYIVTHTIGDIEENTKDYNNNFRYIFDGSQNVFYSIDGYLNISEGYCKCLQDGMYYKFENTEISGLIMAYTFIIESTGKTEVPNDATQIPNNILIKVLKFAIADVWQLGVNVNEASQVFTINSIYEPKLYTNITINELGNGESILYYPSGNVMNAKIINKSAVGVNGCVEYFFSDSTGITLEDILLGDSHLRNKDYIKRFNYFESGSEIHLVPFIYYNNPTTVEQWKLVTSQTNYNNFEELWQNIRDMYSSNNTTNYTYFMSRVLHRVNSALKVKYYKQSNLMDSSGLNVSVYNENYSSSESKKISEYLFNNDYTSRIIKANDATENKYYITEEEWKGMLVSEGVYVISASGNPESYNKDLDWRIEIMYVKDGEAQGLLSFVIIDGEIVKPSDFQIS